MALKKFAQTRWDIESRRVTLYPYRIFNVLSIGFAVVFAAFIVFFNVTLFPDPSQALSTSIPMFLGLAVIVGMLWGIGRTSVVFDNDSQVMRKKLFGLLSIRSERFDDIDNIGVVRNTMGGYNYRAFPKRNKYGKGVVVSANYAKNDDANAIALTQEAFPVIMQFLSTGYTEPAYADTVITDYQFYDTHPPYFAIKRKWVGGLLIGLCLIALALNEIINKTITHDSDMIHKVLVIGGCLLGGTAFVFSTFSKIVFDTANKTVNRYNPLGIGNQTFAFADFINFQITRRSYNFIYSGTDINMYFQVPGSNKQKALVIKSFSSTKKIDQFLRETRHVMALK
ncbi:hypothetical protein MTO98_19970 [Mucilaginibacter sp. SMC90]|uniref:hypothetical protein n=1 Tax=Mucilaginibacter sp. SMC90 TaxID=2929803 RepID=UPI001FB3828F|nr:hypothetical protein [Mucilaginibacter sp. SMC90]UOE46685.1 hypothetical protein MTO98_19970 [Mucilaginibacter sp. SMC90]